MHELSILSVKMGRFFRQGNIALANPLKSMFFLLQIQREEKTNKIGLDERLNMARADAL